MGGNLAIIPARGGSKRIARKNIRHFAGRPILCWSIEIAQKSGLFDQIMVSTDDEEIAEVAREAGAEVPFMRSGEAADDHAPIATVLREVIGSYSANDRIFDRICCLFATAPFIEAEDLKAGFDLLDNSEFEVVIPVARFAYPIQRSLSRSGAGRVLLNHPEHADTRSQDLAEAYHDAGQWIWLNPAYLSRVQPLLGPATGSVVIDSSRVEDIDTEEDWRRAQWKFERLQQEEATL
ncbi:pseudaminic acid cytidylyltransferase [uncultured Erythrobacter sp.]|uniref:pseudaminic acid cytidylyltransferase n=1 Tax=uncultured Erythrobacter sp. TaxID=263913 RepID=UPI00260D50BB|nr:pseudaminic acid cytidylyltransferase [uncultured Erythrobacter sp.]